MPTKDFRGVNCAPYNISLSPPVKGSTVVIAYSNGTQYYCVWEVNDRGNGSYYICTSYETNECYRLLHQETFSLEEAMFWFYAETTKEKERRLQ